MFKYFAFILIFLIILVSALFVINRDKFIVENIEVISDFDINKRHFLRIINIEEGNYIWKYDKNAVTSNIERIFIIDEHKLSFIFPDKIVINLKMREPVARILGRNGQVYFIDRRGTVFNHNISDSRIPMLIVNDNESIVIGRKINSGYNELLNLLWIMKKKYDIYYDAISQINVISDNNQLSYDFNFRTINKTITLKKYLNAENIVDALTVAKVTEWENPIYSSFRIISNGFFYKQEE